MCDIDRDNTREVIRVYLENPEEKLTFKDLRDRIKSSETQIRTALFRLEHSKILTVDY